jgi:periplasmic protein TonB
MSTIKPNAGETLTRRLFARGAMGAMSAAGLIAVSAIAVLAQQTRPQAPAAAPAALSAQQSEPKPAPSSAAITNWQKSLVAHLDRFKRYPPQARGAEGVVSLAFSIDRKGNFVSSRIAKSSGSAVLDAEALAMIKRAAPLPPPPAEVADADLSFVVPIRFAAGGRD